ncbi:hypothetical protein CHU95_05925 [Niveispirillum lacus]|uniref:Glutamine amidotransferase domain-containing protein n=1 Tax=Niveispirillum lacus TaxID=1981099 RepID=A0A255Z2Z7_9PROT|nr:hypothetical protein [Niveispirillum lacus]OYQ35809.1 hypothetical protein CHU95_05925 [Niveispirillum lacus]
MIGQDIALAPLIPWVILLPLALLALLVAFYGLYRRARGGWWRLAGLVVLILALTNPSLVTEKREPIKDVAVVVIDQSPSQKIGDRADRTEKAVAAITEKLSRFSDLEVRFVRAGGGDGGAADVEETRMMEAMTRAVSDVPRGRLAGAILITDGQVHDVAASLPSLADFGPVHAVLTGREDEGDRRLTIVQAPSFGIVGKDITFTIRVDDLPGDGDGAQAAVTLRQDGQDPMMMSVPVGQEVPVTLPLFHGGLNIVELSVQAGPRELTLANNRAAVVVNGVRDRLRVLLVSGEPHAGERTWRNLLKADPAVDLVHFTILRPPEKNDGTPIRELSLIAFPIRELFEMKLSEFDLIIFDRYKKRGVINNMYLANIAEYVERGGAFLEASGPTFATPMSLYRSPIGTILPAEPTGRVLEEPFKPTVTDLGKRHPVTAGLTDAADGIGPWGRWMRQIDVAADKGSVVMSGAEGRPLLILDRVGQGRVAQLASDHFWLWSRGFEGGGPQAELLRRLAHWLMKEPELEEQDLRTAVDGSRITITRRSLEPDTRPVTVTSPADVVQQVEMRDHGSGQAVGTLVASEPGIWRVTDGEKTAVAVVGTLNPPELADVRSTAEKLEPALKATGGGAFWLSGDGSQVPTLRRVRPGRDAAGSGWLGLRGNGDHVVTGVTQTPLLPALPVLLLAIGLLVLAWRREGRG